MRECFCQACLLQGWLLFGANEQKLIHCWIQFCNQFKYTFSISISNLNIARKRCKNYRKFACVFVFLYSTCSTRVKRFISTSASYDNEIQATFSSTSLGSSSRYNVNPGKVEFRIAKKHNLKCVRQNSISKNFSQVPRSIDHLRSLSPNTRSKKWSRVRFQTKH